MKSLRNDKPKSTHLHVCLVDSRHCPAEVDIAESEPLAPGTGKKKCIFSNITNLNNAMIKKVITCSH